MKKLEKLSIWVYLMIVVLGVVGSAIIAVLLAISVIYNWIVGY
tara:strand:+ start:604 stop:732 length:129 start_codon:yes stop_codon:yes gene_type:complete